MKLANIVAVMPIAVGRFTAAKLDWWEAGYFTAGSKRRMRANAKHELHRAVRRTERAHVAAQLEGK